MHSPTAATLFATVLLCGATAVHAREPLWLNAVSVSGGQSNDSDESSVYRIGIQKDWRNSWFTQGAWYLGGYWDTQLGVLKPENGKRNKVYDLSVTPVFRFQRDAHLSSGVTPFAEAGIGIHLLNDTHIGDRSLSSPVQFGALIGMGLGFGERGQYELSYRFTHISNADLKQPNDGVDLHLLKLGYNFN